MASFACKAACCGRVGDALGDVGKGVIVQGQGHLASKIVGIHQIYLLFWGRTWQNDVLIEKKALEGVMAGPSPRRRR